MGKEKIDHSRQRTRRRKIQKQEEMHKSDAENWGCRTSYGNGGGCLVAPPTKVKILSWNYWGLGNPRIVLKIGRLVQEKKLAIVFLMETKIENKQVVRIKLKLGLLNGLAIYLIGNQGGFSLLWRHDIDLEIMNFMQHHVHSKISNDGGL